MSSMRSDKELIIKDGQSIGKALVDHILKLASQSIEENDLFTIGLSGGSMIKYLKENLPNVDTEWSKWRLFFCDERLVSITDPDSTFGEYKSLIGITPLKEQQFITVDSSMEPKAAAVDYEKKIKTFFPTTVWPQFDALLLGMGPDGHTASLFPGHSLLKEDKLWIAAIVDSPKPPPNRVTMTLPVLNNARNCIFVGTGKGKAEMVQRVLETDEPLPANLIKPHNGMLTWILDAEAASSLKQMK